MFFLTFCHRQMCPLGNFGYRWGDYQPPTVIHTKKKKGNTSWHISSFIMMSKLQFCQCKSNSYFCVFSRICIDKRVPCNLGSSEETDWLSSTSTVIHVAKMKEKGTTNWPILFIMLWVNYIFVSGKCINFFFFFHSSK